MAARATHLSIRNFRRSGELKRTTRRLLFWVLVCIAALMTAVVLAGFPLLAAGIPLIIAGSAVAMRRPAPFVLGLLVLSAIFGSLAAFTGLQAGSLIDLLIVILLGGAALRLVSTRRRRSMWVWPGVLAFALYIGLSFCEILTAQDASAGLDSFRTTQLLMLVVLIVAYSGWDAPTFERLAKGAVVIGLLIGGYAAFRWAVGGPGAGTESSYAYSLQGAFITDPATGKVLQIGSFPDQHQLALWTATMAPFCCAAAFLLHGRWRMIAVGATGLQIIAVLGSEVRSGLVALAVGLATVVVLFQFCRSHRGINLGVGFVAGLATTGAVVILYLVTVGPSGQSRFNSILHPSDDPAFVQRKGKWGEALHEIDQHPFGQGLGTAGVTNLQSGRYLTVANAQFDNSFLVIAWQQGFAVMIFFGLALALLAADLARHGISTLDPQRAAVSLGAVGTIVALAVMFYFGSYLDALSIIGAWMIIGLGVAQFSSFEPTTS